MAGDYTPDWTCEGMAHGKRLVEGNQNAWQMGWNSGAEGKQLIEMHFASLGIYSRTRSGLSLQGAREGKGGQRM